MTDRTTPRRLTTLLATVLVVSALAAAPAWAAPPDTWRDTDNPGLAQALLEIGGPVLLVIAVIALLTYLPSMVRGSDGDHSLAFSEKSDWFGGPRAGVDEEAAEVQGTGGASARW